MTEILAYVGILTSIFMGFSIGASTVASTYGPVNGSGSVNVLRSALLAGFFAFLGAVTQGANVTGTIGSGIVVGNLTAAHAVTILFVAASLVIISVLKDVPMPTAFTVIGAVIGVGLASSGIQTGNVFSILAYWVMIPFLSIGLSYVLAKLLRRYLSKEGSEKEIKLLLVVSGSYLAYSAGASAVGLAIGPINGLFNELLLLVVGGLAILLGCWVYSPRIIRAVSFDYSNIGPRRSIAALSSAAVLAQVGIIYGIPISFNQAVIASVIGSGLVEGRSNSDIGKIGKTAIAWILAFILAMSLTFLISMVL